MATPRDVIIQFIIVVVCCSALPMQRKIRTVKELTDRSFGVYKRWVHPLDRAGDDVSTLKTKYWAHPMSDPGIQRILKKEQHHLHKSRSKQTRNKIEAKSSESEKRENNYDISSWGNPLLQSGDRDVFRRRPSASRCPVRPSDQMRTVMPCLITYSENMGEIAGKDIMGDPEYLQIYCDIMRVTRSCVLEHISGCTRSELIQSNLYPTTSQFTGSRLQKALQNMCPKEV